MQMNKGLTAITWTIILGSVLWLTACKKDAEQTVQVGNDIRVEKLFTHEGCTVYRFFDNRYVYYTNCQGSTQSTCGKNCEQNVDTTRVEDETIPN